ncbi:MAG: hypothetical protein ACK4OO_02340 [bacterium]
MPKEDEVREKIKKGLKSLGEKARELSIAAVDYLELQAQIGKLKFEILNLQRQIDRNLNAIGKDVLNESRNPEPHNPLELYSVKNALQEIGRLEEEIAHKRERIAQLTTSAREARNLEKSKSPEPAKVKTPRTKTSTTKKKTPS